MYSNRLHLFWHRTQMQAGLGFQRWNCTRKKIFRILRQGYQNVDFPLDSYVLIRPIIPIPRGIAMSKSPRPGLGEIPVSLGGYLPGSFRSETVLIHLASSIKQIIGRGFVSVSSPPKEPQKGTGRRPAHITGLGKQATEDDYSTSYPGIAPGEPPLHLRYVDSHRRRTTEEESSMRPNGEIPYGELR
jgi:hypothetical protein